MTKKTIEIFRAGKHVGMDGKSYEFSDADVQAIAAGYSRELFQAPVVLGHPKTDDPAYAWVDAVRVEDGVMVADLDQIDPAFAELVENGRYKKVSLSFYPPAAANNPTPGQFYPRHLGFLGAAAPGVKGLAPVEFADGDADYVEFATDDELRPLVWFARGMGRIVGSLREYFIEKEGREAADKIIPSFDADMPAEIAGQLDAALPASPGPRFAEPAAPAASAEANPDDPAAGLAAREADLAQREAALTAREQQQAAAFAETERQGRIAEDDALLDGLVAAGRLPPGLKPQFAAFCEALDAGDAICFSEGEEAAPPRDRFKAMLGQGLGTVIRFDEIAAGDGLQVAEGRSVEDHAAAIDAEMSAASAAGKPISAAEASRRAKSRR